METSAILSSRQVFRSSEVGRSTRVTEEEARDIAEALEFTQKRMGKFYNERQVLGRRDPIGCVALEITQRCNLDCTLCYLSDNSEDVKDLPLEEVFRRIDGIKKDFGPGTVVQVTGGDPTLRDRDELVEIVRYVREQGLQPALFTNGIKATRSMLTRLAEVGLMDVAFHVDMTQEREGYNSEMELNEIRREYIERARGLPISVIFNLTVFEQNFHEIPDIVKFYRENSDVVNFVSFQLQADTGRGELTARDQVISVETVREQITKGAEADLNWDPLLLGHPKCHAFAYAFSIGGSLYNMIDDDKYLLEGLNDFRHVFFDRRLGVWRNLLPFAKIALKKPKWLYRLPVYALPRLWKARKDLLRSKLRVDRLSFFIHNFMDAENLDEERVEACSFMVMTHEGPVSMCAHNARRDDYILKPIEVKAEDGSTYTWDPLKAKKRIKRKARGERQWKGYDSLNVAGNGNGQNGASKNGAGENGSPAKSGGSCGGCSAR